jgi:CRISPR-associated endonuclease/helicase Cas3
MSRFSKKESESEVPVICWDRCYAKSLANGHAGLSVVEHCIIAGQIAAQLVELHGRVAVFPLGVSFFVSSHDVGKVSPGFLKHCSNQALQTVCPELATANMEAVGWNKNHAEIGEAAFKAWAAYREKPSDWMRWAEPIGRHHGIRSQPKQEGVGPYGGPEWARERQKLLDYLFEQFGTELPDSSPTNEQIKLLGGLTCVSDWIASNEDFFPNTGIPKGVELAGLVGQALRDCGWTAPRFRQGLSFGDVFPFAPNDMQRAFIECVDRRGVYVLEAPMGMGKTEAALFAAYQLMASGVNSGLYFGLPTRLTSDRIHQRVEEFMARIIENPTHVKLIHGHAWMNLESHAKEFEAGMSWFHPRKRALLAPFGVGTIDQALLSVLKVKHHFVRTFGLAGKVVILDEVHSYDAYTGTLLNCLVDELLKIGCSVIVLSATLTAQRRADFAVCGNSENAYPLISTQDRTVAPPPPPEREIQIEYCAEPPESLIDRAVAAAENGLCVLWIANTVAQSQEIFLKLQSSRREDSFQTGLLHSRFPAFRRKEIEDDWMDKLGKQGARPPGSILVATQIVEQSVDIDADLLITELAPTDMLLQRMGRLCRHDRETRPNGAGQVWIYGPPDLKWENALEFEEALGISRFVYAPYVLWKTLQVWRNRTKISLPGDIREVLEATYEESGFCPDWIVSLKEDLELRREQLRARALGLTSLYCGDDDEDKAPTRYSTRPTIQVLLVQTCDDCGTSAHLTLCDGTELLLTAGERDFKKAVALHQNMVALSMHSSLKQPVPSWLKTLVYGAVAVLKLEGETLVDLSGDETPWGYHREKGVYKRETGRQQPQSKSWEDEDEFDC